jgi:hypothetical protein
LGLTRPRWKRMRRYVRLCGAPWEYLRRLAEEAGLDSSDDDMLRRMDRKRKKKMPIGEWVNPHDPKTEVTTMKDGTTHLPTRPRRRWI